MSTPTTPAKTRTAIRSSKGLKSKALLMRARQQEVFLLYSKGMTPDQICLEMKMTLNEVNGDIAHATDRMVSLFNSPPQHTFAKYAVFNLNIIRQLQDAAEKAANNKQAQYASTISALKSQSDIYDRILNKGVELGIIDNKPASKAVKTPKNLKNLLRSEIYSLSSLLDEVDLSIQFHASRARATAQPQANRFYVPIIIKPLTTPLGVKSVLPDWKFSKKMQKELTRQVLTSLPEDAEGNQDLTELEILRSELQTYKDKLNELKKSEDISNSSTQQTEMNHAVNQNKEPESNPNEIKYLSPPRR